MAVFVECFALLYLIWKSASSSVDYLQVVNNVFHLGLFAFIVDVVASERLILVQFVASEPVFDERCLANAFLSKQDDLDLLRSAHQRYISADCAARTHN